MRLWVPLAGRFAPTGGDARRSTSPVAPLHSHRSTFIFEYNCGAWEVSYVSSEGAVLSELRDAVVERSKGWRDGGGWASVRGILQSLLPLRGVYRSYAHGGADDGARAGQVERAAYSGVSGEV